MQSDELRRLLREQAGVISRRQVLARGCDDTFIESRLRRKDWASVHTGVYVNHTGQLTWLQRAWAGVLFHWPAALCHESALTAWDIRNTSERQLHVAVDQSRRVRRTSGLQVHRVTSLDDLVHPGRLPPRIRLERSLLDVASSASSDSAAVAVLADACQDGRTTPRRLSDALGPRLRLPRRRLLLTVLDDVAAGAYSVLEHRYLTRVERPHGLPTAERQRRVRPGIAASYRDVEYLQLATVVELDGRLGHEETLDRWADMDRDISAAILGDLTLRVGWGHVLDPCRTALAVARVLRSRGWVESPFPCGPACPVMRDEGAPPAVAAEDAPLSEAG